MSESPELIVARAMRDAARALRSVALDTNVARLAIDEEIKFGAVVQELEKPARDAASAELDERLKALEGK